MGKRFSTFLSFLYDTLLWLENGDRENVEIEESARGLYQLAIQFKHIIGHHYADWNRAKADMLFQLRLVLTRSRYPIGDFPPKIVLNESENFSIRSRL
jgi:hypothetical protein